MKKKKNKKSLYPTPMARALQHPCFKPQIIQKATLYNRKKSRIELYHLFSKDRG